MRWIVCLLTILLSGCHGVSLIERSTDGRPPGCVKGHVVIGLLVEAGSPSQTLAELWTMLPTKAGEQGPEHTFNPRALLPPGTHHVSYHGSLTTPPCNEGVQWIVLGDPITMSAQQVE